MVDNISFLRFGTITKSPGVQVLHMLILATITLSVVVRPIRAVDITAYLGSNCDETTIYPTSCTDCAENYCLSFDEQPIRSVKFWGLTAGITGVVQPREKAGGEYCGGPDDNTFIAEYVNECVDGGNIELFGAMWVTA